MSSNESTRGAIIVQGVRKSFPGADRPALDGVDLRVDAGRVSRPPIGGINLGVSSYSKHADVAFQAAQCLVKPENQIEVAANQQRHQPVAGTDLKRDANARIFGLERQQAAGQQDACHQGTSGRPG